MSRKGKVNADPMAEASIKILSSLDRSVCDFHNNTPNMYIHRTALVGRIAHANAARAREIRMSVLNTKVRFLIFGDDQHLPM